MPIYQGSTPSTKVYLGSTPVQAVYLGSTSLVSSGPTFSSVTPSTVSSGGDIQIKGSGFSAGSVSVTVGGFATSNLTVINDTTLTCTLAGAVTRGSQSIVITTASNTITASNALTVLRATITGYTPTSGVANADLTINGYDFTSPMQVLFSKTGVDPISATNIILVSSNQITCKVPTLTSGDWRVSVKDSANSGSTADTLFTYSSGPTFASISPTSGTGNATVTITGTNFVAGSTTVTIGGQTAGSVSVSGTTSLTCTVPSTLSAGTYSVVITTPQGSVTGTSAFTYTVSPPTYTSTSPTTGGPGVSLTITGTNFISGGTSVTIGGLAASFVNVTSSTSLTCVAPTFSSNGYRNIVITTSAGSATGTNAFISLAAPTLSAISVPQATAGQQVTVSGTNFVGGGTSVTVGGTSATVITVTATTVKFSVPTLSGEGAKTVSVTTAGGTANYTSAFVYYNNYSPATTSYTTAGSGSYPIPAWCTRIDVVVIGGGGGGNGGGAGNNNGGGGGAGTWSAVTLYRGTDLTWGATSLSYTVGTGGNGAPDSFSGGTNGAASSGATISGAGGVGGKGQGIQQAGYAPGNYTWNGATYTGGAAGTPGAGTFYVAAGAGGTPGAGGGGGGGILLGAGTPGGKGGNGAVYFRAVQ